MVPTLPAAAATSSSAPARLTGGKRSGAATFGGGGNASAAEARPFSALPSAGVAGLHRSSTAGASMAMTGAFAGLFAVNSQPVRPLAKRARTGARTHAQKGPPLLPSPPSPALTVSRPDMPTLQVPRKRRLARAIVTGSGQEEHTAAPEAEQQAPASPAKRSRPVSPSVRAGASGGEGEGTAAAEACPMDTSPTNAAAAALVAASTATPASSPTNAAAAALVAASAATPATGGVAAAGLKMSLTRVAGSRAGGGSVGVGGGGGAGPAKMPKIAVKLLCPVAQPINSPSDPAPAPFISAKAARCLVLDNDETTGAYQLGSLLYSMFMNLCATQPPVDLFVENYLKKGGARPGLAQLIQTAAELKANGRIDHIVVWTAASNRNGWVTFLSQCLERLAGVAPGTIDRVLTAEHSTKRHRSGRVIKDLRLITTDTSNIVMVDDKPTFIQHGRVIQVNEYNQHVPIEALVEGMPCSEENKHVARRALVQDQLVNPPSAEDQGGDTELFQVARMLRQLF